MIPQRILVAIDGSEHAEQALAYAQHLAGKLGSKVGLVYVVDPLPAIGPEMIANTILLEELRQEGKRALEKAAAKVSPSPEAFLKFGSAAHEIVACAAQWKADVLVLGTHGRTGLSRVLMGSVAEHVVRHAKCSVLVVRPPTGH